MSKIEIDLEEYNILKEKTEKWDAYTMKLTKNLHSAELTPAERSERARKAVTTRWAKAKQAAKSSPDAS